METEKPLRLVVYRRLGGLDVSHHENWAQIGGKIGHLVGDVDSFAVFEKELRVLFYHVDGIH